MTLFARKLLLLVRISLIFVLCWPLLGEPLPGAASAMATGFFGLDYAQCESTLKCELAASYEQLGAKRVKIANVMWGQIEPNPPDANGDHDYRWWNLDHLVSNWQAAGYEIWMVLRARSSWAGVEPYDPSYKLLASTMPRQEYLDDYQLWVKTIVERYDHDGSADMDTLGHQLRAPLGVYEFESEAQLSMLWQGRSQATRIADYLELLGLARAAAREAYPEVQVVLAGIGTTDIFDDFPSPAEIEERVSALDAEDELMMREAMGFTQQTLAATDLYDLVEFHANSNYTGLYGAVQWIRGMMPASKPLWAGDSSSAPMLIEAAGNNFNPPYPGQTGQQLYQRTQAGEPAAVAWLRKEQAELTAKKLIAGMELGLASVSVGNVTDWPEYFSGPNWAYQGMVDGGVWDYDPAVHPPRPVFYTYGLLVEKLGGYTAVERLPLSLANPTAEIYAYRFAVNDHPIFVLWYEDYVDQQPGEAEGSANVQLAVGSSAVTVTHIITTVGQSEPLIETLSAPNGQVTLTVTETPILVELTVSGSSMASFTVTREGYVYGRAFFCGLASSDACFKTAGGDIAEHIALSESVEAGDVVEIDPARVGFYQKSRRAYSPLVVGVIAATPGVTLGDARRAEQRIDRGQVLALVGTVSVKATTENGPIQTGDLLTSASAVGYAMRCPPSSLALCEGAMIGKALEPLQTGTGVIRMLIVK